MNKMAGLLLAPFSACYGAVSGARRALYRSGVLHADRINAPIISVGNITAGGTGKTPLVEWVARVVNREGRRVSILTRGYGRVDAKKRVVVSDGERILADAREGGDEPRLLAEALQDVASVISDANRAEAARWALANLQSEVFILDDGFQHLRLARDLDLVVIDATNPFGGGRLLPRGRLREPLRELARADCLIITRSEQAPELDALREELKHLSHNRPLLLSRSRTRALYPLHTMTLTDNEPDLAFHPSSLIPHPSLRSVAAFCAIGNPSAFFAHLRRDGHDLKLWRAFPDHHVYTQSEIDALVREAKQAGAQALLTTTKDAVKLRELRFDLPCYVLEIELEFDNEERLTGMIREAIQAKPVSYLRERVGGNDER